MYLEFRAAFMIFMAQSHSVHVLWFLVHKSTSVDLRKSNIIKSLAYFI